MLVRSILVSLQGIRESIRFLTRIPLGAGAPTPEGLRWAPAHFPGVGLALGLLGVGLYALLGPLSSVQRVLLISGILLLVTGAFHEDGLADTADALGGAFTRDRILDILKDSRIGTFGAVALFIVMSLRVALLQDSMSACPWIFVAGQAFSRVPPVWMMRLMPYVTRDAEGRSRVLMGVQAPQVAVATIWGSVALCGVMTSVGSSPLRGGVAVLSSLLVAFYLSARFRVRLGGITGDFLGATQQLCEVAFYLGWALCPS